MVAVEAFTRSGAPKRRPAGATANSIDGTPFMPSVYQAAYAVPLPSKATSPPRWGQAVIFHPSSCTRTGASKLRPPSRETPSTMSRTSPEKTFRHSAATASAGPRLTATRQQTQVSSSSRVEDAGRVPSSSTRATQVAAFSGPSRLSIHAITTAPSRATVVPSNECEIGRSSFTRTWPSQLRPPSRDRDRRRSDAKSTSGGRGRSEDHDTYTTPPGPAAMSGE